MIGLIQNRPNQVIHGAVYHHEPFYVGLLDIKHTGYEYPRVADQNTPGFDDYGQLQEAETAPDKVSPGHHPGREISARCHRDEGRARLWQVSARPQQTVRSR